MITIKSRTALAKAFCFVFAMGATTSAVAADPPAHVRGTIVSTTADSLTVKTAQGTVKVATDSSTASPASFRAVLPRSRKVRSSASPTCPPAPERQARWRSLSSRRL